MTIRAIAFDLGNVVLTNDWTYRCPEKYRAFRKHFGISKSYMDNKWKAIRMKFLAGRVTEKEFWKFVLEGAKRNNSDIETAKKLWKKYQKPQDGMLKLAGSLKSHYKIAALTNIPREWLDYKREKFRLDKYFSPIISSSESGICKPNARIYRILFKKTGIKPAYWLFVDDSKTNIQVAEKLGMKVLLFRNRKDLVRRMKTIGVHTE